jgi:hypothetical protein
MTGHAQGADIEIIDRHSGDSGVLLPSALRVNGVEIPIPGDAKIRIGDLSADEFVTVTITMFARRITITNEQDH